MAFTIAQVFLFILFVALLAWTMVTVMKTLQMLIEDAVKKHYDEVYDIDKELDERLEEEFESNAGDPLYAPDEPQIVIPSLFPDQYETWDVEGNPNQHKLFYFDFDCDGKKEMGDRNPVGVLTLMRDYYPQNGKLDCGFEIFWDLKKTAYEKAQVHDTNKNCHIDSGDSHWGQFMLTDYDMAWHPEELGYEKFKICEPIIFENDPFGVGRYSDGYEGYVPDEAFRKAIEAGWQVPEKITNSHFRLKGMMEDGAVMLDGTTQRTYSGVLGFWEKVK